MTIRLTSRRAILAALCVVLGAAPVAASAQAYEFPGRHLYERFGVEAIDLFDLRGQLSSSTLVDVRPRLEYDIMHIEGAHHVDMERSDFEQQVLALKSEHGGPLVFYCNGRQSYLSYRAAARATEAGIQSAEAYDAGVKDWADRYPGLARLKGGPVNAEDLISEEAFEARLLEGERFAEQIASQPDAMVLDVRSSSDRDEVSLFQGREINAPLSDVDGLNRTLAEAQRAGQTLYIFDQHGQQVRWLQYHLRERGIDDYYFLAGGMQRFYDEVMN